ncbi:MAG: exodeoxyribonuclease V subunit beta [Methylomonas sp.]|jgi:exodeoxyribonuclease V beta subunit
MAYEAFEALGSPLQTGVNLIEASAGTGKTYTIATLVLRFVVERDLNIKDLLVVTFTKAATEELKERIRSRLVEARANLIETGCGAPGDTDLGKWLQGLPHEAALIRRRLDRALLDIDQAAIFTIHGFCQRVLTEHALESGQMFDCELSADISASRQNCADDFWRAQLYKRPLWQVSLLTSAYANPEALLDSINNISLRQTVYPDDSDPEPIFNTLRTLLADAGKSLPALLEKLESACAEGYFNDSYLRIVTANSAGLSKWLADPDGGYADFSWLTTAGLLAGLNGRKFMPSHSRPLTGAEQKQRFLADRGFDAGVIDRLADALQQLRVVFRCALLRHLRERLSSVLEQQNVWSFDDLINRLAAALSGEYSAFLTAQLQQRFKVALIDEFQDTDDQQWRIFATIFTAPDQYLYLIGDPKQAIYKFRGADIYSYFQARRQAAHCYTLQYNRRSHPHLVAAVNCLFQRQDPFLFPELPFHPVSAARSPASGAIGATPPLEFWQLQQNTGNLEHWTAGKAGQVLRLAVVNEILQLLAGAGAVAVEDGVSRSLQAGDMAILVRSNAQAFEYQQALRAAGIPSVVNSKQSVFAAPEARAIYHVLQAVAQPADIQALKQALMLDWFNLDGQELYRLTNDESGLDAWLSRFQGYHELWRQSGLLCMMQNLLRQEQVEQRLAGRPGAERILTNLHHILERLQQASIDERLAINKTLDWLRRAMQQAEQDSGEDRQLRLESDADAVKIVTLHSAKGLEYPLVFCPALWQRSDRLKSEQNQIQCHENELMIADLGSEQFSERRQQALYEELAEDIRLCYVALTRAKYRCYLAWADVRSKENANDSALAYLLEFAGTDFAAQQRKLQDYANARPQFFSYRLIAADESVTGRYQPPQTVAELSCRQFQRSLYSLWQMSSYTALTALSRNDAPDLPADKAQETTEAELSGAGLPKGAQTGNVIHGLLETLGFQTLANGGDISRSRDLAIRRYGLRIEAPHLIDELLQTITSTPLSEDPAFCLKNISNKNCIKEMPFYLATRHLDSEAINRILSVSPAYQPLAARQMSGFLTGFIDLVCCYQNQFYLIDYKTNSLADYQPETLLQAMCEHNYGLQYWLYALVLDRYLQQRLPNYEYRRHFGGVKYLFVRGMAPDKPGYGVFSDRPQLETLQALAGALFD